MWHMCPVLIFDSVLIEREFVIYLYLKGIIAKHWIRLVKLVNFVGRLAFDTVYGCACFGCFQGV